MQIEDYRDTNIHEQATRWMQRIGQVARPRPHLNWDISKCALVIVDMNHYFTHPSGRCYLPVSAAIVPQILKWLTYWRKHQGTVAFAKHGHEGPEDAGMFGTFFRDYIDADSPSAELISSLAPVDGEKVFLKSSYDAFLRTSMESFFHERGVLQVMLCGVLTHMCVETTARSAFCRGFEVYIPVDAVAADNQANHENSLLAMAQTAAILSTTKEWLG